MYHAWRRARAVRAAGGAAEDLLPHLLTARLPLSPRAHAQHPGAAADVSRGGGRDSLLQAQRASAAYQEHHAAADVQEVAPRAAVSAEGGGQRFAQHDVTGQQRGSQHRRRQSRKQEHSSIGVRVELTREQQSEQRYGGSRRTENRNYFKAQAHHANAHGRPEVETVLQAPGRHSSKTALASRANQRGCRRKAGSRRHF